MAWIVHARQGDMLTSDGDFVANAEGISSIRSTPLYTAPPAPVAVPDDGREQFEEWVKFHLEDEHSIVTLHRANGGLNYRDPHVDLAWIAWKESRAAMLQGDESAVPPTTVQPAPELDSSPKNDESPTANSTVIPDCSCRTCHPVTFTDSRFVVCADCGNKRCPKANDHRNACSGSNEPGQAGSAYPASPVVGDFRERSGMSTNRSREHFISLCNQFWNWQESDEINAGDEEPRLEWNGKEFTHRVTQALWRMYQAAPEQEV